MGAFKAWLPYVLIAAILILTRLPFLIVQPVLNRWTLTWVSILGQPGVDFSIAPLYVPGIIPFLLVSVLALFLYRLSVRESVKVFTQTTKQLLPAAVALFFSVAVVRILIQSQVNPLGLESMVITMSSFASEIFRRSWPFFAPFVGILGAFISGSNTVSNLLFGGFQFGVAENLGISRIFVLALQGIGGAVGNMICVHNVVAVGATVGVLGREGRIVRQNLFPAVLYGLGVGLVGQVIVMLLGGRLY